MNQRLKFSPSIRQLRAFHSVFHLGKLSAAAEQLSLTQSAVSVLIRQLEEGLGTRLFDRTTRSLRATQAASEVISIAERVLRDVDSLGAGLRDLGQLRRGRVSLAITPTLGEILLPAVVRRFGKLHPEIRVVVDDCAPDQFVSRIVGEHVDFGIGAPERAAADVDTERIMTDTLALVCRKDDPLAARARIRWANLEGVPVITVRPGYGIRQMIDGAAAQAGVMLDVPNEVTFYSTALWMTQAGAGPSIMPTAYAQASRHKDLLVRRLHDPVISRDISLVTKRGRSLSPAAAALAGAIRSELGKP
ncbi:MAG: LysR family transcriptional regulator [Variovorax sp.]|nr:LysR family transcriptional regulator [Variovorax sp.]